MTIKPMEFPEDHAHVVLLANIKSDMEHLELLKATVEEHWAIEDGVYRFYHQSFKVFYLQGHTRTIVEALRRLGTIKHEWFEAIINDGTGLTFNTDTNSKWLEVTRPIVEAFFHAKYFLDMVVKYGKELVEPTQMLPSGWAAVLYLYGLR